MPSLREIEDFVFRAEIESVKEECGFETDEEASETADAENGSELEQSGTISEIN